MNAMSRYVGLSRLERRLLALSFVVVGSMKLSLWIFPIRPITRTLDRLSQRLTLRTSCELYTIQRLVWAVRVVSRYVPRATCLTQALSGKFLIKSCTGRDVQLQIGVRLDEQKRFEAHAWLECEGEIVLGGDGVRSFTPIFKM